jgi:hypothetical protein
MNMKHVAVLLVAVVASTGIPALVFAQTMDAGAPIVVSRVVVFPAEAIGNGEMWRPGFIDLEFHNAATVVATDLFFDVDVDGVYFQSIHASGTFAPGAIVRQVFADEVGAGDQGITVTRVKFADGSVWFKDYAGIALLDGSTAPGG